MASLKMNGPYLLIPDKIDKYIKTKTPGNYALGYVAEQNFVVLYVGRDDFDLNTRLKSLVYAKSNCLFFKYSLANSAQEAYIKECKNYHDFGKASQLKNEKHPQVQPGSDWECLLCNGD
ncbi:MAG: hypothetical protein ABIG64_00735 [Candidatus Omnitrophota bacterium]